MRLFDDPGYKIKTLAFILFVMNTIACVLVAIYLLSKSSDNFPFFILIILVGPIVQWLISLFIYGLGQLIESSQLSETILEDTIEKLDEISRKIDSFGNQEIESIEQYPLDN